MTIQHPHYFIAIALQLTPPAVHQVPVEAVEAVIFAYALFVLADESQGNERFLVCSDGVWEAMSIDEIEECLCENALETANNIAEKLFAMQERCNDNISFIIMGS